MAAPLKSKAGRKRRRSDIGQADASGLSVADLVRSIQEKSGGGLYESVLPGYMVDPVCWVREKRPFIESKTKGLVPFEPYPYQDGIIRLWWECGGHIFEKSRQMGVSTAIDAAAAPHALLYSHAVLGIPLHMHIVADDEATALNMLLKVKIALSTADLTADERACLSGIEIDRAVPEIRYWTEGAHNYIRAHTSTEGAVRSFDGNAAQLEEFAFMRSPQGVWQAVASMLESPGARLMAVSTPRGASFHGELCDKAQNDPDFKMDYHGLDWRARPDRDEQWKREQMALIGPSLFAEEHELKRVGAGEALIHIATVDEFAAETPWLGNRPIPGRRYSKGFDLATGFGKDFMVFTAVDISDRRAQVVCMEPHQKVTAEEKLRLIEAFHARFPGPGRVDGTNDTTFATNVCNRCRGIIPVRFTGGALGSTSHDEAERMEWENLPRDLMQSALTTNLETGRLVVHKAHFPELHLALQTAQRWAVTKDGKQQTTNKTKRLGKHPDFFDSAMLSNAHLRRTQRPGKPRTAVGLKSSKQLQDLRGRKW